MTEVPVSTFLAEAKKEYAQLLDVRTLPELEAGFVPGSLHVDYKLSGFEDAVSQLDRTKTYLVFCASGVRSSRAAAIMRAKGLTVLTLQGGLAAGGIATVSALPVPEYLIYYRSPNPTDSVRGIFSLPQGDIYAQIECIDGNPLYCRQFRADFSNETFGRDSTFANPVEAQNHVFGQFRSTTLSH